MHPHLEATAALRKIRVAVDPVQAVHVHRMPRQPLAALACAFAAGRAEAHLRMDVDAVRCAALVDEGKVEEVAVVRHVDGRLCLRAEQAQAS